MSGEGIMVGEGPGLSGEAPPISGEGVGVSGEAPPISGEGLMVAR